MLGLLEIITRAGSYEYATLCLQRFNLASTTSFASLDPYWKAQLVRLHDDYLETRQVNCNHCLLPYNSSETITYQ